MRRGGDRAQDGSPHLLTDADIEALADEAERGYDFTKARSDLEQSIVSGGDSGRRRKESVSAEALSLGFDRTTARIPKRRRS